MDHNNFGNILYNDYIDDDFNMNEENYQQSLTLFMNDLLTVFLNVGLLLTPVILFYNLKHLRSRLFKKRRHYNLDLHTETESETESESESETEVETDSETDINEDVPLNDIREIDENIDDNINYNIDDNIDDNIVNLKKSLNYQINSILRDLD